MLLLMLHSNNLLSSALTASTVRHLYLRGGAGVGSMTKIYGSRQRNGVCPAHYSVGSKNVARKVLQALELLKMIEKDPNGYVPLDNILHLKLEMFSLFKVEQGLCFCRHRVVGTTLNSCSPQFSSAFSYLQNHDVK